MLSINEILQIASTQRGFVAHLPGAQTCSDGMCQGVPLSVLGKGRNAMA